MQLRIPERRRAVVFQLPLALLALLLKDTQLGRHRIFTTCHVYRKLATKFKVVVFLRVYCRILLTIMLELCFMLLLLFLNILGHNYLKTSNGSNSTPGRNAQKKQWQHSWRTSDSSPSTVSLVPLLMTCCAIVLYADIGIQRQLLAEANLDLKKAVTMAYA